MYVINLSMIKQIKQHLCIYGRLVQPGYQQCASKGLDLRVYYIFKKRKNIFSPYISGKASGRIDQLPILTVPTLTSDGKEVELKGKTDLALTYTKSYSIRSFSHNCICQWNSPHNGMLQKSLWILVELFDFGVYLNTCWQVWKIRSLEIKLYRICEHYKTGAQL